MGLTRDAGCNKNKKALEHCCSAFLLPEYKLNVY